ncbi:barstar family protein [Streptomyces sp. NPDC058045]|uniref:barstar family protein n=1 Tax=Streptomyces sp. NPDC058045 TaxID=3346311 RepID=UPI0036E86EB7
MTDPAFAPVLEAVRATGWTSSVLDLSGAADKAAFLERCAVSLELPDWFGHNWDALADCLRDLSWLPVSRGRLLLVSGWSDFARERPGDWATAREILTEAETEWAARGAQGFAVLLTTH